MQTSNFIAFLNTLLVINPANGVLLIGAGNGRGQFVEWLIQNKLNAATLVEPQDAAFKQLEAHISGTISTANQSWILLKEVIAEQPGLVDFYYTSKSAENGLVSPELLNYIWPNLALVQTETLSATSLSALYSNAAQTHNWLIIDCIGALKVVGQPANLANVDVAIIKVLFNAEDTVNTFSDYATIAEFFNAHGFDEKYRYTGIHPDIGYVVYVRNYQAQFNALKQELIALTTAHEQGLAQHKAEQASLLDQIQASNTTNKQNAIHIQHQQALIEQLQVKLDTATASYEQALTQYQAEQEAWHAANQKSKAESQQQVELIAQQQSQIQQLQQQLGGLKTTHEKTVTQLKELELKNEASLARENKLQTRYELMCEEIERAEAQLNLIKEMGL